MPTATKTWTPEELDQVSLELENQGPEATLKWMVDEFHPSLYVACSFQQEESVLLDMLHRIKPDVRIFYLDTDVLFAETTTLGVRWQEWQRTVLARERVEVDTAHGKVAVKVARRHGVVTNAQPEFDECLRLATSRGVPVKEVWAAALFAYRQQAPQGP